MLRNFVSSLVTASLLAWPAFAQEEDTQIAALYDALAIEDILGVMQEEGIIYGEELGRDMLPGGASEDWRAAVASIYDIDKMNDAVFASFSTAIADDDVGAMLDFFASERGQRIIALEVDARRAMLDEEVEEASKQAAALQMADETPRYTAVRDFIETNDLVESNVVGALNSSYAFYIGLIDGGVMPPGVTADTALQDVWAQEPEIRISTTEWVYAFLLLAYEPLSEQDLAAYQDFSETQAGADLNDALFAAFDGMFEDISRALGLTASQFMISQEL